MFHLDQERSKHALQQVAKLRTEADASRLLTELKGLPARLAINNPMAVWLHGSLSRQLRTALENWLIHYEDPYSGMRPLDWGAVPGGGLVERLHSTDETTYQRVWDESIHYATWLKRWATALIPETDAHQLAEPPE